MPKPAFDQVEKLFHDAVALPADRRVHFLNVACRGDAELRAAVDELLRHDRANTETENFLVSPVNQAAAQLRPTLPAVNSIADAPTIPGYEILGDLGRGGMGVVYMARQTNLNRIVALKMLLQPELAGREQIARFKSEAELLARLHHPNIIPIYDVGTCDGRPFFTMEFVNGPSLAKYQGSRPQSINDSANLIEVLAHAMHVVHQHGIIHRDLKPSNILLQVGGPPLATGSDTPSLDAVKASLRLSASIIPKITDFGLAKDQAADQNLTQTGMAMGTPCYMAPEQARGKMDEVGPAADIYSLGAILFELLTGRPPFDAATSAETIVQLLNDPPPPPSRFVAGLPRDLVTICLKCLEKAPNRRYATAWELAEDLRRFQANEPIHARRVGWIERTIRWCRRHPLAAALATLCGLLACAFVITVAIYDSQLREALAQKTALAEQERKQIVQLNVIVGTRAEEAGDFFAAALRFAEALRLDDPTEQREHRARIAAVMQACPRLVEIFHANRKILCSRISASGILVATIDANRNLDIQNVATGQPLGRAVHLESLPTKSALSDDGRWLATVNAEGSAQVWNMSDATSAEFTASGMSPIKSVSFAAPTVIVTKHADATVRRWEIANGRPEVQPLPEVVRTPSLAESNHWHLAIQGDGTGQLCDLATGKTKAKLALGANVLHAAVSSQGERVATIAKDQSVVIFQVMSGTSIAVVHHLDGAVVHLQFSPDGHRLMLMDAHGTVRVWDAATAKAVTPPLRNNGQLAGVDFHANGNQVVMINGNGEVHVWEMPGTSARSAGPLDWQPHHRPIEELISLIQLYAHSHVNEHQKVEPNSADHSRALVEKIKASKPAH